MKANQPILSCAGREAVSIDTALLQELLFSFTPNTIGIKTHAHNIAGALMMIADGAHPNDAHEVFKRIITTEFLSVQLMEASKLARQSSADAVADLPSLDYM
jgi:hypothetical protein